jgi:hypothetical protein
MVRFARWPRYSLRTLFGVTLITALCVNAAVVAGQRRREARRAVFMADIQAQIVVSERIAPEYSEKLLNFVQRRVTDSPDTKLISVLERQQFVKLIESKRPSRRLAQLTDSPVEPLVDPLVDPMVLAEYRSE